MLWNKGRLCIRRLISYITGENLVPKKRAYFFLFKFIRLLDFLNAVKIWVSAEEAQHHLNISPSDGEAEGDGPLGLFSFFRGKWKPDRSAPPAEESWENTQTPPGACFQAQLHQVSAVFISSERTNSVAHFFNFNVTGMIKDVWLTFQPGSASPVLHCMHTLVLSLLKFSIKNSALMDFICTHFF